MKRIFNYIALGVIVITIFGCSSSGEQADGKHQETREEMEAASMAGREAAREFVNADWLDTMDLQRRLMDARSRQSEFIKDHGEKSAEAFDSAFVSTLRSVNPALYNQLQK